MEDALDPAAMLAHLSDVLHGSALHPVYDARSLAWLLDQTARKTRHGRLRARAVRDRERLLGWYLYYVQAGGASEVVQLAARDGSYDRVLQRLLADAWRHGAAAVQGRLDPRFANEFSDRHCWMRTNGTWTLVHSRHRDVMDAIHQGNAFLSRLEGRVTVKDKRLWIKPGRGAVTLFNEILNQRSEVVCTVEVIVLLATRAESAAAGS